MDNSHKYFENRTCRYFPCHKKDGDFNCLFCYCPMYVYEDCPGNPEYADKNGKKIKICTNCSFPHAPENYEYIMQFLKNKNNE